MNKYKIRASHILIDIHSERESSSIKSMSELSKYGIEYTQNINKYYYGDAWKNYKPLGGWLSHSHGHWGLFQAFKKSIETQFTEDLDAFLIFESDCVLDVSPEEFQNLVNQAIEYCDENKVSYLSFGSTDSGDGIIYSIEIEESKSDKFMITNQIIRTHCILFPKSSRDFLLNHVNNSWDALDLWLNQICETYAKKMAISRETISRQIGDSTIDIESTINLHEHANIVIAHINSDWKKILLEESIKSFSGGDIILSCNSTVDDYLMRMFDWVIYSKDNPIIHKSEYDKYGIFFSYRSFDGDVGDDIPFENEHSWAVYNLILNGLRYAKALGKKTVTILNYDYKLNPRVISENIYHLHKYDLVIYPQQHIEYVGVSTGFITGKIDTLLEFFEQYRNIEEYYEKYNLLEYKFKDFCVNSIYDIKYLPFNKLSDHNLLDREGVPPFDNSNNKYNRFKIISDKYGCDKTTHHTYDGVYSDILYKYINAEISLLEIGYGDGKSLNVWKEYLPNAKIWGMDSNISMKHDRGEVFKGDPSNEDDLAKISSHIPLCEVIIDGDTHVMEHQILTFEYLFENVLKNGGYYIIEDIEVPYKGGNGAIYEYKPTGKNIAHHFSEIVHNINHRYNNSPDMGIESITYHSNCIVIRKSI